MIGQFVCCPSVDQIEFRKGRHEAVFLSVLATMANVCFWPKAGALVGDSRGSFWG
jgi:hypothetical protein